MFHLVSTQLTARLQRGPWAMKRGNNETCGYLGPVNSRCVHNAGRGVSANRFPAGNRRFQTMHTKRTAKTGDNTGRCDSGWGYNEPPESSTTVKSRCYDGPSGRVPRVAPRRQKGFQLSGGTRVPAGFTPGGDFALRAVAQARPKTKGPLGRSRGWAVHS